MEHNLFKSKSFEDGKHSVVGDCNGISMQERWDKETPLFASAILAAVEPKPKTLLEKFTILDYGCGVGRLAKEILKQNPMVTVIGVDDSSDQLARAKEYVQSDRFIPMLPHELDVQVDACYCVYVLQHVPSVEIRSILMRIHTYLTQGGKFVYCSSDYRMAIRFDGQGFFDDRFLGVNPREEVSRLFSEERELFDHIVNPDGIISKMVYGAGGGLEHPAKVYVKLAIDGPLFNARPACVKKTQESDISKAECKETPKKDVRRLVLRNRLSPGDILVMSVAIRALKQKYGEQFEIRVDSPCNEIFENSPYLTDFPTSNEDTVIDMQYPEIHRSGASGRHFVDGHRKFLEETLGLEIPRVGLLPDIFLSHDEKNWPSPVLKAFDYSGKYWVINAGSKGDYPLKQYHRWQEVVDQFCQRFPEVKLVQIGQAEHNHPALNGVLDMRGKTNIRQLFRVCHHAEGVLSCVSFPMHIAAALEKPCVVVAGGREPVRWEMYGSHRFLSTNGALGCCLYDGCWKSKIEECVDRVEYNDAKNNYERFLVPKCQDIIRPEDIMRAVELYYLGGVLNTQEVAHVR